MDTPPTAAQATPVGSAKVLDMTNVSTNGSGPDGQDALQKEMLAIDQERRELIKSGAVKGYTYVDQQEAQLNTGHRIPVVGLGTWKAAKGEVHAAVVTALKAGYRHIDCAAVYGNEHEVGAAFHEVFQEGHLGREEVFVTSKLWNTEHAPSRVEAACRKTLSDLQLSQLDLYLIHWPSSLGLVRSIGVSNFSSKKMEALIAEARIKPAVLQVEAHTYFRHHGPWCRHALPHEGPSCGAGGGSSGPQPCSGDAAVGGAAGHLCAAQEREPWPHCRQPGPVQLEPERRRHAGAGGNTNPDTHGGGYLFDACLWAIQDAARPLGRVT
ncbi:low CO2-induced aldose reductase [Haematococcus lacustris]|uniref:Low CO2-induced aldose reductase n=1 Tax=Haematococcus lacustris TaxID=44745 RepID=A0A699ZY83_HAELA|nr:low CO2-induced aldose reductase [Haematococcus lacustris]